MKLIDKRELMKLLDDMFSRYDGTPSVMEGFKYGLDAVISEVSVMPTIETEPVRHGHWIFTNKRNIYGGTSIKCSECGYEGMVGHIEDHHYCWVCGAKMDVGEEE